VQCRTGGRRENEINGGVMFYFFLAVYVLVGLVNLREQWWRSMLCFLYERKAYEDFANEGAYKNAEIEPIIAFLNVIGWPWVFLFPVVMTLYTIGLALIMGIGRCCIYAVGLKHRIA
jgi:hypothetical protein